MKLTESCVIEQHIDRLLEGVEPTNFGFGTLDAAALIVRIVWSWANDMAVASKDGQDADVVLPNDLETPTAQWEPCDTKFWQRCDDGWTVDGTTKGN